MHSKLWARCQAPLDECVLPIMLLDNQRLYWCHFRL